jgi:hypothetical protein
MKLTTQVAWVLVVAIVAFVGLVVGLAVFANWSDGAIGAMIAGFGGIIVNTVLILRNQQVQGAKLDEIADHTNGSLSRRDDTIAGLTAMNRQQAQMIAQRDAQIQHLRVRHDPGTGI